jgi:hypothetical protein
MLAWVAEQSDLAMGELRNRLGTRRSVGTHEISIPAAASKRQSTPSSPV